MIFLSGQIEGCLPVKIKTNTKVTLVYLESVLELTWGRERVLFRYKNSLVLHCASSLRTLFASLARAHKRVHVQNVRDSPQTKLDSEINSPFLLTNMVTPDFFFRDLLRIV